MPSGQVATMRCHLGQVLGQVKGHFAVELKIPEEVILIMYDGKCSATTQQDEGSSETEPFCGTHSNVQTFPVFHASLKTDVLLLWNFSR